MRLIDLEHAGLEGKPEYVLDAWPLKNGVYTKSVDISMLYDMIMNYYSIIQEDKEALAFVAGLMKGNSVEEVLLHARLSN